MNGGASDVFIDTNILVFATIIQVPFHQQARNRLQSLHQTPAILWISPQVIREYLAVVTRPQTFSQPLSTADAARDARVLMQRFRLAEENAAVTASLLQLLNTIQISGKQVHDANIVATMQTHGIGQLLTHNVSDFARYSHLITVLPLTGSPTTGQTTV